MKWVSYALSITAFVLSLISLQTSRSNYEATVQTYKNNEARYLGQVVTVVMSDKVAQSFQVAGEYGEYREYDPTVSLLYDAGVAEEGYRIYTVDPMQGYIVIRRGDSQSIMVPATYGEVVFIFVAPLEGSKASAVAVNCSYKNTDCIANSLRTAMVSRPFIQWEVGQ